MWGDGTPYTGPDGSLSYTYDHDGQLTGVSGAHNETYTYENNGNRNMSGYTYTTGNEISADAAGNSFTEDDDGNVVTKTDSSGNIWTYTFDFHNRLTQVIEKNSGGTTIFTESFTYDVFGNLIGVSVNGTQQRWTVFSAYSPYMDFNGSGSLTQRILSDPQALDRYFAILSSSGTLEWLLTDNEGSTREVVNASGSVLDAITYYATVNSRIERNMESDFDWLGYGDQLASSKDFVGAIRAYTEALKIDSHHAAILARRAKAYCQNGEHAHALSDANQAVAASPQDSYALRIRAGILCRLGRVEDSISDLTVAMDLNPEDWEPAWERGYIFWHLKGNRDRAISDFTTAINRNPRCFDARMSLGAAYATEKDYSRAIDNFTAALDILPTYAPGYLLRGRAYTNSGQYGLAISDFNQAIRLDPSEWKGYVRRAEALARSGRYREALDDYSRAHQSAPENAWVRASRASARLREGETSEAITDFTEAIRLEPNSSLLHYARGKAYLSRGDVQQAVAAFTEAIRLDPKNARARDTLRELVGAPKKEITETPGQE